MKAPFSLVVSWVFWSALLSVAVLGGCRRAPSAPPPEPEKPQQTKAELAKLDPATHPILPALLWAREATEHIEKDIRDYSAVFVKQERIDGVLQPRQSMFIKVRHKPFSVYLHILEPADQKGDEAIYVEGSNHGNLLGHTTGVTGYLTGTLALSPTGRIAMQGQRRPITNMGILNLMRLLCAAAERQLDCRECSVRFLSDGKLNGVACTCIEVAFVAQEEPKRLQLVRVFGDQKHRVPIRYEEYDPPKTPDGKPELVAEYSYLDFKPNQGFTDADFDVKNPKYGYKEGKR